MEIKKIDNKTIVKLLPSPTSAYSIFSYVLSLILLSVIIYICYAFFPSYITAFAVALIPVALLVFNLKVNIWSIFGEETLVLTKSKLSSSMDYQYIYNKKSAEFDKSKGEYMLLSSKDGSFHPILSKDLEEHKSNKFRIVLRENDKTIYQTSNILTYQQVQELQENL